MEEGYGKGVSSKGKGKDMNERCSLHHVEPTELGIISQHGHRRHRRGSIAIDSDNQ